LSRDVFFIFLLIALAGFILGRKHIFFKGLLLLGLVLYFIFIKKESFFIQNAAIYLVTSTAFLFVLYFLVGILNDLIEGLEESNILANTLKKTETKKKITLQKYQNTLLTITKDQSLYKGDLQQLYRKICLHAADGLSASRMSIWTLEENGSKIIRKHLFELSNGNDDYVCLGRTDFPHYF
jgi:hypothetical protein